METKVDGLPDARSSNEVTKTSEEIEPVKNLDEPVLNIVRMSSLVGHIVVIEEGEEDDRSSSIEEDSNNVPEDNVGVITNDKEKLIKEKEELNSQINNIMKEMEQLETYRSSADSTIEQLKKQLEDEKMKKVWAVNKLTEMVNRKDFKEQDKQCRKVSGAELKKKDKECRKLQQELNQEKEKFNKAVDKFQRDTSELQATLNVETQKVLRLKMELDAKESEIEQLQQRLAVQNSDTMSISSAGFDQNGDESLLAMENQLEGWLSIPNKQNKKFGWKKQYVVVSKKEILFYESESCRQNAEPNLVLDVDKIINVRVITQNDAIRADAKDIPKIFQIIYAMEDENKKMLEKNGDPALADKHGVTQYKGHDFLTIHFRTPTTCDSCSKPVWHMIHPPTALECRRCLVKVHKEHLDKGEECIGVCKVTFSVFAKDLLLLASSREEQQNWVKRLGKKVTQQCYVSSGGDKGTPGSVAITHGQAGIFPHQHGLTTG